MFLNDCVAFFEASARNKHYISLFFPFLVLDTFHLFFFCSSLFLLCTLGAVDFPQNLPTLFGPLNPTAGCTSLPGVGACDEEDGLPRFPHNVKFVTGNYVLESEDLLDAVVPEFDVITCLSTTKWMHLNFGDDGIKRVLKRIHAHLRPGKLIYLLQLFFSRSNFKY